MKHTKIWEEMYEELTIKIGIMETINHECYVSLEVAKLLKKAGFDYECEVCYIGKSKTPYKYDRYFNWNMPRKDFEKEGSDNLFHAFINQKKTANFISAPTLEIVQRWLREVKNIDINILAESISGNKRYAVLGIWFNISDVNASPVVLDTWRYYKLYEEALEAGIKKVLEIILEKGE